MPQPLLTLIQKPLMQLVSTWVKPAVLPANPLDLIDPNLPIVYVLESGGLADQTALDIITKSHHLPAPFSPVNFGSCYETTCVSVLKHRPYPFGRRRNTLSPRLQRLLAAANDTHTELQIIPVAIYWGRAPMREDSFWRFLFTENWEIGGRTRKLLTTWIHGRRTLVSFSKPLSIIGLKETETSHKTLDRKLHRILRVHFRERRIASLGPDMSHRRTLIGSVVADSAVQKIIHTKSEGQSAARRKHQRQAEKYAREIAADVSYPTTRLLHRLLTRLWTKLYDGVELSGAERLKAVADGRELVYVPCHRSHIDYLLMSYILYEEGYALPHIAAGLNLNLPVIGGILRRGGAFFLRRSFSGNKLYAAVFNAYLKQILQRGHALEYFVEGGRSRTGRLLPPKGGMLAMTVHAYLRNPRTPVAFIPVYFGYERLLEGKAFTSELAGRKKRAESLFGLLGSLKFLRQKYGSVHVNFGEAILLDSVLDSEYPLWRDQTVSLDKPVWLAPVVNELGTNIMQEINRSASVTPISVLATAALATTQGTLSEQELTRQIDVYRQLLGILYKSTNVVIPSMNAADTIAHAERLGFVRQRDDELGTLVFINSGQAAPLTYFRNNIAHLLVLPSLIASCFYNSAARTTREIQDLIQMAHPYLQAEYFIKEVADDAQISSVIHALQEMALLRESGTGWRRATAGSAQAISLLTLADCVTPSLERYYLTLAVFQFANNRISPEKLHLHCAAAAKRLALTHGKIEGDLYDKHLLQTFLNTLKAQQHLQETDGLVSVRTDLEPLEAKARSLLQERTRHAILNAARLSIQQPSRGT